jgi:actin related protein 2/3 complex subunit 1A/1B
MASFARKKTSGAPKKLAPVISAHAWNWDRTMCAVSPNNNKIHIYTGCDNPDVSKWELAYDLSSEHTMQVSALDWSPVTNKLVSCSHDRNAFVWTYSEESGVWEPSLVILRINRGALDVKWSPDGKKFAVASGAKCVPICHYEEANDWWISKMIKKHKSTVLSVAWHPNSQLIATGCCDFKCRVFSAFVSGVDTASEETLFGDLTDTFGELLAEFDQSHGWVVSVGFSASGNKLAFAGHDSSLSFVHFQGEDEQPTVQTIHTRSLPLSKVMFCSESQLVGVGHEMNPTEFTMGGDMIWGVARKLDEMTSTTKVKGGSRFSDAKNIFGGGGARSGKNSKTKTECKTRHTGCITCVNSLSPPGEAITKFATTGVDGKLFFWDL